MSETDSYKIFISYRRDDTQATVDHIYDWLVRAFARELGAKAIFKDVDAIPVGYGFPGVVASKMRQCRVALIVIGPSWTTLLSHDDPYTGQPRLNDPADNVRVEVEQALVLAPMNEAGEPASQLLLIPVLVQGARMPRAEQLPESLRPLTLRNGTPIRPDPDFAHDTWRLITRMADWMGVTADDPRGGHVTPPVVTPPPSSPTPADPIADLLARFLPQLRAAFDAQDWPQVARLAAFIQRSVPAERLP